jgi:hypothetical protein
MGNLYRFNVAESKCGNQIAPSPTIINKENFKFKITFIVNLYPTNVENWASS